jgi:hypothetical protein
VVVSYITSGIIPPMIDVARAVRFECGGKVGGSGITLRSVTGNGGTLRNITGLIGGGGLMILLWSKGGHGAHMVT